MKPEYSVVTDGAVILRGLLAFIDPCEITVIPQLEHTPYATLINCQIARNLRDSMALAELLIQFEYIYVHENVYFELVENLLSKEGVELKRDWQYIRSIKANDVEKIRLRNAQILFKELIENGVIRTVDLSKMGVHQKLKENPYGHKLAKAIGNTYEDSNGKRFLDAYFLHLFNTTGHLRLSHSSIPYYNIASGFKDVGHTLTHIEEVISHMGDQHSAVIKELNNYRKAFPLEETVSSPFIFHLILSRAKSYTRLVDVLFELREEFSGLRKKFHTLEETISDTELVLNQRIKAKNEIDFIKAESMKPYNVVDSETHTCWRDFMRDLWSTPKNMFNGITVEDLEARNITQFILNYPVDYLVKAIKKRRLCNLPKVKSQILKSRSFTHEFEKVFGCPIHPLILSGVKKYECDTFAAPTTRWFYENPDKMAVQ